MIVGGRSMLLKSGKSPSARQNRDTGAKSPLRQYVMEGAHYGRQTRQLIGRIGIPTPRRSVLIWRRRKGFQRRNDAEAQTWKEQPRSFRPWARLHGNERHIQS